MKHDWGIQSGGPVSWGRDEDRTHGTTTELTRERPGASAKVGWGDEHAVPSLHEA